MTRLRFDPGQRVRRIVLAGLGGTGGHLARLLARMLYDMDQRSLQRPTLCFVDPDRVETRNVGRQNFSVRDAATGSFKAELLARRFNYCLGLDIEWINEPFDPARYGDRWSTLIVDAVDNHEARRAIAQADTLTISCGNHHSAGQVCIGSTTDGERVQQALERIPLDKEEAIISVLPAPALQFPELLEPEPDPDAAAGQSCAELVVQGQQHLLINDTMATIAAHYVYHVLHRVPFDACVTFVDCETLAMRSVPLTREGVLSYLV